MLASLACGIPELTLVRCSACVAVIQNRIREIITLSVILAVIVHRRIRVFALVDGELLEPFSLSIADREPATAAPAAASSHCPG